MFIVVNLERSAYHSEFIKQIGEAINIIDQIIDGILCCWRWCARRTCSCLFFESDDKQQVNCFAFDSEIKKKEEAALRNSACSDKFSWFTSFSLSLSLSFSWRINERTSDWNTLHERKIASRPEIKTTLVGTNSVCYGFVTSIVVI